MSKRLRIKLNLLVRRTWSNLTDSYYLNHIAASSTFLAISSTTSTYTGSTVSCTSSQAVPTTPGMHSTVYIYLHIHRITVWPLWWILFETNRSLTATGFYSDTLAKNDRVPQSNGLLNLYTCLRQNYNSLNQKTPRFKVSHDHVFETWSATSKIKKCQARNVTQNSVTHSPLDQSNHWSTSLRI